MEPLSLPTRETAAAVMVAYHPDEGLVERLVRVAGQVSTVIVVDNASIPPVRQRLPGLQSVEVVRNERNVGVAAALNEGMRLAISQGCRWVLTLDQDSIVDPDIVDRLAAIYRQAAGRLRVGLISANARSPRSELVGSPCRDAAAAYEERTTVITSGSLIALAAYARAGPFREDFFIEGVDLEYCLRLRRAGYRILQSCRPLMTHAAGTMDEVRLLGRTILVPHHQPWRYYYMIRNFLLIVRGYYRQEPVWVCAAAVGVMKMIARVALFEHGRAAKFAAMLRGLWDGITAGAAAGGL